MPPHCARSDAPPRTARSRYQRLVSTVSCRSRVRELGSSSASAPSDVAIAAGLLPDERSYHSHTHQGTLAHLCYSSLADTSLCTAASCPAMPCCNQPQPPQARTRSSAQHPLPSSPFSPSSSPSSPCSCIKQGAALAYATGAHGHLPPPPPQCTGLAHSHPEHTDRLTALPSHVPRQPAVTAPPAAGHHMSSTCRTQPRHMPQTCTDLRATGTSLPPTPAPPCTAPVARATCRCGPVAGT
jgi:hypothetical protein